MKRVTWFLSKNLLHKTCSSLLFIILVASCKDKECGPDKVVNDKFLGPNGARFSNYSGDEHLFFQDSTGQEIEFVPFMHVDGLSSRQLLTLCEGESELENSYLTANVKVDQYSYETPDKKKWIALGLSVRSISPEYRIASNDTLLLDRIQAIAQANQPNNIYDIIFMDFFLPRYNAFDGVNPELFEQSRIYDGVEDLTLHGKVFTNVYYRKDSLGNEIYLSEDAGLIGMKYANEQILWVLDRKE